jgi:hypothetical protein
MQQRQQPQGGAGARGGRGGGQDPTHEPTPRSDRVAQPFSLEDSQR